MVDALKQNEAEVKASQYHKNFASIEEEVEAFSFKPLKAGVAFRFPVVEETTKTGIIKSPQMIKDEKSKLEAKLEKGDVGLEDYAVVMAVGPEAYNAGLRPGHRILSRGQAFELILPNVPKGVYGYTDYYDILGYIAGTQVKSTEKFADL